MEADVMTDLEAVVAQVDKGGLRDPVLQKRIRERSWAIRERVLQEHGLIEIAADLVREARDE